MLLCSFFVVLQNKNLLNAVKNETNRGSEIMRKLESKT